METQFGAPPLTVQQKFSLSQKLIKCLAHTSSEIKGIVKGFFLMQSVPDSCSTI